MVFLFNYRTSMFARSVLWLQHLGSCFIIHITPKKNVEGCYLDQFNGIVVPHVLTSLVPISLIRVAKKAIDPTALQGSLAALKYT